MVSDRVSRQLIALKLHAFVSTAILAGLAVSGYRGQNATSFDVIRVKGIVVVDSEGRERILIGAPIPTSADRVRSNFDKVNAAWGSRFGGKMDWYKSLNNSTNGMVVLNEKGFDRIVLGDPQPDPNIGKRIDAGPGICINDPSGFERAGFSYFDKIDRVSLGLDSASGEGSGIVVDKDGTAGLWFNGTGSDSGAVGWMPPNSLFNDQKKVFSGLLIKSKTKIAHQSGTWVSPQPKQGH